MLWFVRKQELERGWVFQTEKSILGKKVGKLYRICKKLALSTKLWAKLRKHEFNENIL